MTVTCVRTDNRNKGHRTIWEDSGKIVFPIDVDDRYHHLLLMFANNFPLSLTNSCQRHSTFENAVKKLNELLRGGGLLWEEVQVKWKWLEECGKFGNWAVDKQLAYHIPNSVTST